jgi:hypothetical protein
MYNNESLFVDNPLDRYSINSYTGLKNNTDGSVAIRIQYQSPGPDKESNWLPAPAEEFSLTVRLYVPEESVLKGEYQFPSIRQTG